MTQVKRDQIRTLEKDVEWQKKRMQKNEESPRGVAGAWEDESKIKREDVLREIEDPSLIPPMPPKERELSRPAEPEKHRAETGTSPGETPTSDEKTTVPKALQTLQKSLSEAPHESPPKDGQKSLPDSSVGKEADIARKKLEVPVNIPREELEVVEQAETKEEKKGVGSREYPEGDPYRETVE